MCSYWLAQQLLAVRDAHCTVLVHVQYVCVHALCSVRVWDQTG